MIYMSTVLAPPQQSEAVHRLGPVHGVRVLEEGFEGARPYLVIAAHSVQAADFAEETLRMLAGVSPEAWSHGWVLRDAELTLRIYPD